MHQTHKVVFLLFDDHLTAIFDATKLPQFLVLPIYLCKHTIWLWYVSVILLYCSLKYAHAYFYFKLSWLHFILVVAVDLKETQECPKSPHDLFI